MISLVGLATAVPGFRVSPAETKATLSSIAGDKAARTYAKMVDSSGINVRHVVAPVSELLNLRTINDRSRQYLRHALALGGEVARRALAMADVAPSDVDTVMSVSCTGHPLPSARRASR